MDINFTHDWDEHEGKDVFERFELKKDFGLFENSLKKRLKRQHLAIKLTKNTMVNYYRDNIPLKRDSEKRSRSIKMEKAKKKNTL